MDESTRPSHTHRQGSANARRVLAVFLFLGLEAHQVQATPSPQDTVKEPATASLPRENSYTMSIASVEAGQESIAMAARLTEDSTFVARDVTWKVWDTAGDMLLDATANELQSPLPPGDYVIEAHYGAVRLRESLNLSEGKSITVNFVLNAGGLRVLPDVQGLPSGDLETKALVYALSGPERGKLLAQSNVPGELLKLRAGTYRVESRIGKGNTTAVTDVRIRPGKISAVEVVHHAGIAHLLFAAAADGAVRWHVRDVAGDVVATLDGPDLRMPLKPGDYVAEALLNGKTTRATFTIVEGEERRVVLGE